jgi:hypothetical protein
MGWCRPFQINDREACMGEAHGIDDRHPPLVRAVVSQRLRRPEKLGGIRSAPPKDDACASYNYQGAAGRPDRWPEFRVARASDL